MTCWRCNYCPACRKRLIHLSGRNGKESSSAFGQVLSREFARGKFGLMDVDMVQRQDGQFRTSGLPLLRVLEQKQPTSKLEYAQHATLLLMATAIDHMIACPYEHARFDPRSGVYIIRGIAVDEDTGHHRTTLQWPQEIERLGARPATGTLSSLRDLFRWLLAGQTPGAIKALSWPKG